MGMTRSEWAREVEILLRSETRPKVVAVLMEFGRALTRWDRNETLQRETLRVKNGETLQKETLQKETLQCPVCQRRREQAVARLRRHREARRGG